MQSVGYAIAIAVGSVVLMAWLFDFLDAHGFHLRPHWEKKMKEATDDQDDC
ncbi:hypothetical protein [Weissella confusa]|uniref:hypothetical protein n=1 Tax=Weissella confusa TaxID=1583 RepID=UPI0014368BD2|nr:hypothetical protein [Weissella confusa]